MPQETLPSDQLPLRPEASQSAEALETPGWEKVHGGYVEVDARRPLEDASAVGLDGPLLSIVADLSLGPDAKRAVVLRHEQPGKVENDRYFIIGVTGFGKEAVPSGYYTELVGIEPKQLGSAKGVINLWQGDKRASGVRAVAVQRVGGVLRIDDRSQHPAHVRGWALNRADDHYTSDHTMTSLRLAGIDGKITTDDNGHRYFRGHRVIDRDTNDFEGVVDTRSWVGKGANIFVDSRRSPERYGGLWSNFETRILSDGQHAKRDAATVLDVLNRTIGDEIEYDRDFTLRADRFVRQVDPEFRELGLEYALTHGKGDCRYMALAGAWLCNEATKRGLLKGSVVTEVSMRAGRDGEYVSHQWMRYTDADGTVYIVDPANGVSSRLSDLARNKKGWNYFHKGEREAYLAQDRAGVVLGATVEVDAHFTPTDAIKMNFAALSSRAEWLDSDNITAQEARVLEEDINDLTAEAVRVVSEDVLARRDALTSRNMFNYLMSDMAGGLRHFGIPFDASHKTWGMLKREQKLFLDAVTALNNTELDDMPPQLQKSFIDYKKHFLGVVVDELSKRSSL